MAETDFEIVDARFRHCVITSARVEELYTGCRWAEGPAYFPAHRTLIWSDIPNNRLLRWDEPTGAVGVYRQPSGYANGNTVDCQGRLVTCEHGSRRVTRTEHDGSITVIADCFDGKRLNSPNDVVVARDGAVWFTDPPYGIDSNYEGYRADPEQARSRLYRVDRMSGRVAAAADDFERPNGLAFAPDGTQLYVSDTGGTHRTGGPRHIRRFRVGDGARLTGGEVFATCDAGFFDGLRLDTAGRIWTSAGDGVRVYDPDGTLLGKIRVPQPVANLVFGGAKRNHLFICATSALYAVLLPVDGAPSC